MNESRPSKKQHELLSYIEDFIKSNGYGPSYREVMRALDYKSVSTVAIHIDGLVQHGLLRKKDNSARSLEVVTAEKTAPTSSTDSHELWLRKEVEARLVRLKAKEDERIRGELTVLIEAMRILGLGSKSDLDVY